MMKWRAWAGILTAITVTSFVGAISGTLAWYAYSTEASVSASGITVHNDQQLQIGLVTHEKVKVPTTLDIRSREDTSYYEYTMELRNAVSLADRDAFTLRTGQTVMDTYLHYSINKESEKAKGIRYSEYYETDTDGDGYFDTVYWFVDEGYSLTDDMIRNYLFKTGKTDTECLMPVTSNVYVLGDSLKLMHSPSALSDRDQFEETEQHGRADIEFCFRVFSIGDTQDTKQYLGNQPIWLTDTTAHTVNVLHEDTDAEGAKNSIRIFFEGQDYTHNEKRVLFAPNYENNGETVVGGVLDLDGDGYYDYETPLDAPTTKREHLYGNYSYPQSQAAALAHADQDFLDDINHYYDGEVGNKNTFVAAHKAGVNIYHNDYYNVDFGTAAYQGREAVMPTARQRSQSGVENNEENQAKVLAMTADDDEKIATLNMTVYLEGWDHAVVNSMVDYTFQLGLTFEISKVA